jgi:glycosyltransferase involved in cell wall biosynthesis
MVASRGRRPFVHIVTSEYPPQGGGLESWTKELAQFLSGLGVGVAVYVCGTSVMSTRTDEGFDVVDIGSLRSDWLPPLSELNLADRRLSAERSRLDYNLLKNEIFRRLSTSYARHFVLSNFAIGVGPLAAIVSEALAIEHIALVVGTDFSRGFRNYSERAILREVCVQAMKVVCKSEEQAAAISRWGIAKKVVVIPTSVDIPLWRHKLNDQLEEVVIFSDCGFSYHKGTGVLFDAFAKTVDAGVTARLVICGKTATGQERYWNERASFLKRRYDDRVLIEGFKEKQWIEKMLQSSSLYCSATLGEGSSAARIAALCAGIPVLTTRCGELWENAASATHVRLVGVGAAEEFATSFKSFCVDLLKGEVVVDEAAVNEWRRTFDRKTEWAAWETLLGELAIEAH